MPRRLLIASSLLLLVLSLSACNTQNSDDTKSLDNNPSPLQISVVSSSVTPTENRVVLAFWDGQNRVASVQEVQIKARLTQDDSQTVRWEGTATNYSDYEIPYWVAYPEFNQAGTWFLDLAITQEDGQSFENSVALNVYETPIGIAVGSDAYPSENRVWDGASDIKLISSATEPNPAFYEKTIASALNEDKPLVITFSTPGLCESKICAPVMQSVEALWSEYNEQINFSHVEVYEDFETLSWVATMNEWGLQNEPWVYVVNAEGIVTARLDGPVAPSELEFHLEVVLSNAQ